MLLKVLKPAVSLEDATATITMEKHVPTATMQEALNLAGNYAIEMSKPTSDPDKSRRIRYKILLWW
jgi:hypothetical protein